MSGGHFDYQQYRIAEIADQIEQLIYQNGKKKEGFIESSWESEYHYKYPPAVIAEFKKGLYILRKAHIYAHRIDWLVSGDDGEKSFISRLHEDLEKLKNDD